MNHSTVHNFVDIHGIKTHYHVNGPIGAPNLLLIHGFMTSMYSWRGIWENLAEKYRVYRIDLPGYGETKFENQLSPTIEGYSNFIFYFLKEMQLGKIIIIGAQMGGSIASWFTARNPNKVSKLVIISAGVLGESNDNIWLYRLLSLPFVGELVTMIFPYNLFAKKFKKACFNQEAFPDKVLRIYFNNFKKNGAKQISIGLKIRSGYGDKFEKLKSIISNINMPTLLIWGENDYIVPLSTAQRFMQYLPQSKLSIISNCGDFPHEEYPSVVSSKIIAFLR